MNIIRLAAIGTLALALHPQAQAATPTPGSAQLAASMLSSQPASSPTMEQTIAFMNQELVARGEISLKPHERTVSQFMTLEDGCSLVDRSEVVYQYPTDAWPDSGKAWMNGAGSSIAVLRLDRSEPLTVTVGAEDGGYPVFVTGLVTLRDPPVSVAPVELPKKTSSDVQDARVKSVSPKEVLLIAGGRIVRVPLDKKTQIHGGLAPGDVVYLQWTGQFSDFTNLTQYKRVDENRPSRFDLASFRDKDTAERVAKSLIHAIVLCHKPKPPSPF
jgi:hypothetical protein